MAHVSCRLFLLLLYCSLLDFPWVSDSFPFKSLSHRFQLNVTFLARPHMNLHKSPWSSLSEHAQAVVCRFTSNALSRLSGLGYHASPMGLHLYHTVQHTTEGINWVLGAVLEMPSVKAGQRPGRSGHQAQGDLGGSSKNQLVIAQHSRVPGRPRSKCPVF